MEKTSLSAQDSNAQHPWPRCLKSLDDNLRCGICYDYMQTCVITPCSHSYCSVCVRTYLTYKSECPSCHSDLSDAGLRSNRIVDSIIQTYDQVKLMVLSHSCPTPSQNGSEIPKDVHLVKSCDTVQAGPSNSIPQISFARPSENPISVAAQASSSAVLTSKVPCPVCSVEIKEIFINSHLDACLKKASNSSSKPSSTENSNLHRKQLPKLVYSLLSEKELRKKLKDLGLSTKGDKRTLERRHQRFTVLYNAECDSVKPRPVPDLIREAEREEAAERKHASSQPRSLKTDRNSDEASIEQERQRYLRENENHFKLIMQQARNKKSSVTEDTSNEDVVVLENVPKKEKTIIEATIDDTGSEKEVSKDGLFSEDDNTCDFSSGVIKSKEPGNSTVLDPVSSLPVGLDETSLPSDSEQYSSPSKRRRRTQGKNKDVRFINHKLDKYARENVPRGKERSSFGFNTGTGSFWHTTPVCPEITGLSC